MASESDDLISEEYIHKVFHKHVYSKCNATTDNSYTSPYGSRQPHEDLIECCKACGRDTTELKRALEAVKDAVMHLKHVTDVETSFLRKKVDSIKIKPRGEDLT